MDTRKKKENPGRIGIPKFWAWNLRQVSYGCAVVIMGYISLYCTNTLMMPPALVGTILLASKVFDGVTDLLAGFLIDNTKTRFGKARPYEFAIVLLWLCTWLMFSCSPEWSTTVKAVWIFIMYSLVNSVFGTLLLSNSTLYMVRAFPRHEQIERLSTLGGILVTFGTAIISTLLPTMVSTIATSASGWSKMIAMIAVPLALIGMLRFLIVKEVADNDMKTAQKLSFSEMLIVFKNNPYIYIICIITLASSLCSSIGANTYYFTYIVGDLSKMSIFGLLSLPLTLVMFGFPKLLKRVPAIRLVMMGGILGIIGYLLMFIADTNMTLLMLGNIIVGVAYMPLCYLIPLLIIDCATFNEWKGLPRMEATMQAFQSFGTKIGQGVGTALAGLLLGMVGFNGAATSIAELNSGSVFMIRFLYGLLPAISYLVVFLACLFYKLDKKMPQIQSDLEARKQEQNN